jgi:LysR family transcriptional regulator, mexEF-oprN operon transcriptional activator
MCSVTNFSTVGAIVDGSNLVATVPDMIAAHIQALRPHLQIAKLPFPFGPFEIELMWPTALDTDPACRFVREALLRVASERLRPHRH